MIYSRNSSRTLLFLFIGLLVAAALVAKTAVFAATDRYITPAGTDAGDCSNVGTPCKTLVYVVSQAVGGDTVHLAAGTYSGAGNQNVQVNKALIFIGAGTATTFIEPAGDGFEILADNVTVQELTFRNASSGRWAVRLWKNLGTISNTTFDTVHFLNNQTRGIELHNNTTINNLIVRDSLFGGNSEHGIRMSSNVVVDGLDLLNTTFQNNGIAGFRQSDGAGHLRDLHVDNSTFTDNIYGIHVHELRDSLIENSHYSGNEIGVWYDDDVNLAPVYSGNTTIEDNTFNNHTASAIVAHFDTSELNNKLTIQNNMITQNVGLLTGASAQIEVGMDFTTTHAAVDILGNQITLSGTFGGATAAHAIKLLGGLDNVTLDGNILNGGNVGHNGATPPTSGVFLSTNNSQFGSTHANTHVLLTKNQIANFVNGVSIFDEVNSVFGNVPVGAMVEITRNSLAGNSGFGTRSGATTPVIGTCNWWGAADGPSGSGPGTGNAVSDFITFNPWLGSNDLNQACGNPSSIYDIFISPNKNANFPAAGFAHADEDILAYDFDTDTWAFLFDGSDVGIKTNLTGFTFDPFGCLLMSFNGNEKKLAGMGMVKPQDVVKFCPTQLGENTAGTFSWVLDGSDVGLTTKGEIIDALELLPDGRLLLSTKNTYKLPATGGGDLTGDKTDLLVFNYTVYGENSAGDWELYLDGSTIPGMKKENIIGAYVNPFNGDIHISFWDAFNIDGVAGDVNDIIILRPLGGGAYDVLPYFNAADHGFTNRLHSIHVDLP